MDDHEFLWSVDVDTHSKLVFLRVQAADETDSYELSLGLEFLSAARMAEALLEAAKKVALRGDD